MLPYFRSMEAFFNLSLPKERLSLSDRQHLFFFSLLSQDRAMEENLTLCLFKWAGLLSFAILTARSSSDMIPAASPSNMTSTKSVQASARLIKRHKTNEAAGLQRNQAASRCVYI